MFACGANFGSLFADIDMTAVAALPAVLAGADPDFAGFNVGEKFPVALFVTLFDSGNALKDPCQFGVAFLFSFDSESAVHFGPLFMFTGCCGSEIFQSGANAVQLFEPEFGMFLFIVGSLLKDGSDLLIAFLACLGSKIGVFVPCLGFTGEGVLKILPGL